MSARYHLEVERAAESLRCFYPFTVEWSDHGEAHSGPGFYVWSSDYPDDGADFMGTNADVVELAKAIVAEEHADE